MHILPFLRLIRWPNLVFVVFIQVLVFFRIEWICETSPIQCQIDHLSGILIILTTVLITAAGYVINDIKDVQIDLVNKPDLVIINRDIPILQARRLYRLLILLSGAGAATLTYLFQHWIYFGFFVVSTFILYTYSARWKGKPFIGNLIVGMMCGLAILVMLVPDWRNQLIMEGLPSTLQVICALSWFAAIVTVYREVIKDLEDVEGDKIGNAKTLPVVLGLELAKRWALAIGVIILVNIILWILYTIYQTHVLLSIGTIVLFCALCYSQIKLYRAKTTQKMHFISQFVKFIMLFGIIVLILY